MILICTGLGYYGSHVQGRSVGWCKDEIPTDDRRWSSSGSPVKAAIGSPLVGFARNEKGLLSTCEGVHDAI